MKALHIAHNVYPLAQAGTEIYTAELARALSSQGVETLIAIPSYAVGRVPAATVAKLGDNVRIIPMSPGGWWGNKVRALAAKRPLWQESLQGLIRDFRPDVVHVQHAVGFGLAALNLLGREGVPMVVTLPDYWLLCEGILFACKGDLWKCGSQCLAPRRRSTVGKIAGYFRARSRARRIRRFVSRYRPTLAAISDSTRRAFEQAGFPPALLVTRPWGIDTTRFRRAERARTAAERVPRVGYLGSLRAHKGCHVLLEAFTQIRPTAELHFYGSGDEPYSDSLRRAAGSAPVFFHGRYDHDEVPSILADLDVVVIPSVWDETYCLVYQEALAARKPVIASRVGGLSDRVVDGVNGFLVPPGDTRALAQRLSAVLASYPEIRDRLDYDRCMITLEEDAREWIKLYDRAIERGPGTRRPGGASLIGAVKLERAWSVG